MPLKAYIINYKGEILYIFSSIVAPIISILGNIIVTIYINPTDMGIINNVMLIVTYASFLQLGVFNGLNRNISFYKAQNRLDIVQSMVNTSHTVSLIVAGIGALFGVWYGFYVKNSGFLYLMSAILLFCQLVFTPLFTHYDTTYRSGQEFQRLASIKFIESLIYSIIVFFPVLLGYIGKIISDSIKPILSFCLRVHKQPIKSTGYGRVNDYYNLLKTGFPMLLSGYLWNLFQVADQTYISANFGVDELGLYSLSRYCVLAFMILPQAINAVLYPKASSQYGVTGNQLVLIQFWKKSLFLYIALLFPIVLLLYFLAPLVVSYVMPQYIPGIECMKINLITCCSFIYMGPSVIFGVLRKNLLYIIMIGVCLVLFWLIVSFYHHIFTTSESVAYLRLGLSYLLAIISIFLSRYYIHCV